MAAPGPNSTRNSTTASLAYNPMDVEVEALQYAQQIAQLSAQMTPPNLGQQQVANQLGQQLGQDAAANLPTSSGGNSNPGVFGWLLAWGVAILFVILAARTQIGYRLIYYGLALLILFLMLTNYKWFAATLKPLETVSIS